MKKILSILATLLVLGGTGKALGQNIRASYKTDINIVSVNDVHAAIENMPKMAAIVDSLRAVDKDLMVISAGDNRTGNPVNDMYSDPSYPMIALMNQMGFLCSAFGNHEFDSGQAGLARNINESAFPYICANIFTDQELGIQYIPYKFFYVKGVKICILGVVEAEFNGIPSTHPNNVKGMRFAQAEETIRKYLWLRDECDVFILLSHIGYEEDVEVAKKFPQFDLIIGGHSHTQIDGGELHNGVLITQNENKLKKLTHTVLVVENGKVTGKSATNINVKDYPKQNVASKCLVDFFSDNPEFKRVLAQAQTPFSSYEELGIMMCDALKDFSGADIAYCNSGGVRYEDHPAGDFTVNDVLRLDPFGNTAVIVNVTGKELRDMLIACKSQDSHGFPFTSGISCEVTYTDKQQSGVKDLKLFGQDGKPLNLNKKYKVIANSYAIITSDVPGDDQGEDINALTADILMKYLEKMKTVSYQGRKCLKENY
ncbi:MAG: bifunctional metallophosphatase/5'-nucleotidase [Bacteroidales bacterium]|nr:bifunctional metallophosphatase/5'-nucleotidase [Bacteroidales bacterium]